MKTLRGIALLAFGLAFSFGVSSNALAQQEVQQKLEEMQRQIDELRDENSDLRNKVEDLEDGGGGGIEDSIAGIQEELGKRAPYGRLSGGAFLRPDGQTGFVDRIVYGGEWRTRADYRYNTVDLIDELDDEGFRLDYRFNLGLGFEWGVGQDGEDTHRTQIRTWFEIQAAGRAANNTAENIPSFSGVSIGDFSTRDNDLDQVRLYQAYLELEDIFAVDSLRLKVGRQEITLGSKLIMGTNEFYTGTVHDAVRLDYVFESLGNAQGTLFYAKEAASDGQFPPGLASGGLLASQYRASGDEDELVGVYVANSELLDPVTVDLYYFYFNGRSGDPNVRPDNITSASDPAIDAFGRSSIQGRIHTFGTWLRSDRLIEDFYLSLEVAYQVGTDDLDEDLDALIVEFLVEYNLPFLEEYAGRIHAGYYFAEGADSGSQAGFSPLFIARHDNQPVHGHGAYGRLGNIDLIPTTNIHVFHVGFKFSPDLDQRWTLGITYLYAVLNHSREMLTTTNLGNIFLDDRQLGHEIDLYAVYQMSRQIEMFFNATVFIPHADFVLEQANPQGGANPFTKLDTEIAIGVFAQIQIRF